MSKIIITIEDKINGEVSVDFVTDPPVKRARKPRTDAERLAAAVIDFISNQEDDGEAL